jgi:hypothetical protein
MDKRNLKRRLGITFNRNKIQEIHLKDYISVSCFFGQYPSSQFLNKTRFIGWLCLRPQVIKKRKGKEGGDPINWSNDED